MAEEKLAFASDYMRGAHPAVLQALIDTNMQATPGYGLDDICAETSRAILAACECPEGEVYYLSGGTQANEIVITTVLRPWQGVIAADTGHVSVHEAGAIEAGGHKVLTVPHHLGKISADDVQAVLATHAADANRDHMVEPGMVYISQPTEYGTLYSLTELEEIAEICHDAQIPLFVDGARLAYALACPENDVTLADLARLCDVFYIGGTKCGTLFGEAVVVPEAGRIPHFFTIIKQRGALLAKGRALGAQFGALFAGAEDGQGVEASQGNEGSQPTAGGQRCLYQRIGEPAITGAARIREALAAAGFEMPIPSPTNQVFFLVDDATLERLAERAAYGFMETWPDGRQLVRLATSWYTTPEEVDAVCDLIMQISA